VKPDFSDTLSKQKKAVKIEAHSITFACPIEILVYRIFCLNFQSVIIDLPFAIECTVEPLPPDSHQIKITSYQLGAFLSL